MELGVVLEVVEASVVVEEVIMEVGRVMVGVLELVAV